MAIRRRLSLGAGFAVRPFGAMVFGRIGDLVGRKYAFLVALTVKGMATFLTCRVPTYAQVGIPAPVILVTLFPRPRRNPRHPKRLRRRRV
jgi:MFS family permease